MTAALSDAQQVFNQRLLSEHCVDQTVAENLWDEIIQDYEHDNMSFPEALSASNAQLQLQLGLELVSLSIDNTRYYTIINKNPHDEVNKTVLQSSFFPLANNPEQLQSFCKRLLQGLVNDKSMTRASAINMRGGGEGGDVPLNDAQIFVDRLVDEKWLVVKSGKRYSNNSILILGPRTYAELSYMLVEEFGMDEADVPQQIFL
jgi:hypothetical protein